jgi:hypothetical protein
MRMTLKLRPLGDYFKDAKPLAVDLGRGFRGQLGSQAGEQGVYVIFERAGRALYVGKTSGPEMDFGTRLYRHTHSKAAQSNPKVYKLLAKLKRKHRSVSVSMIDEAAVRSHYTDDDGGLRKETAVGIFELALIDALDPCLQPDVARLRAQ